MLKKKELSRKLLITNDGSYTLHIPEWDEHYHSKHGALQEAKHVFIENGVQKLSNLKSVRILEMGFGTGLNAILSAEWAMKNNVKIEYIGVEKYPLGVSEIEGLKYGDFLNENLFDLFLKMHAIDWNQKNQINALFNLEKMSVDFFQLNLEKESLDVIYFDAFGIRVQPELWTAEIFEPLYTFLKTGGLLTTYASNGNARRALQSVGFEVEKVPGPPGKREMMIAWKR